MQVEQRLDFALDATDTGLWTYNVTTRAFAWDSRLRAIWGKDDQAPSFEEFASTFVGDGGELFKAMLAEAGTQQPMADDLELKIRPFDASAEKWIAIRCKQFADRGDVEIVGTARDITKSRQHDRHVYVLMREVTHRSKNLLAIIQAMARQTVKDSLTAADFELRFSSRLRGLSFSHEILAVQNWRGASINELVQAHLSSLFEHHSDRVAVEGPDLFITPEAAQNIGLALNELSSNAQRFGALSGANGQVFLGWTVEDDEAGQPRWLNFVWKEQGGSPVDPPSRHGFGHKVMQGVVARALDGMVNMTFAPTGLQWSLRIPVLHILPADAPAMVFDPNT